MREISESEGGLDLVVVDYLQMIVTDEYLSNYDDVKSIHKRLDELAEELNCRVLVNTKIQDV